MKKNEKPVARKAEPKKSVRVDDLSPRKNPKGGMSEIVIKKPVDKSTPTLS